MAKEKQTERAAIRFTPTEARMLTELAELTGMTKTNIVRQAIRREYTDCSRSMAIRREYTERTSKPR